VDRIGPAQLAELGRHFTGEVVTPESGDYDDARRVWNAVIDRRPALVLRPTDATDVQVALRFALDRGLPIAVRSGGHSGAGHSVIDDGVVIDLRRMNTVEVDPDRRIAVAAGGALLGSLDKAGQEHGLICPIGVIGHTGVGGLTLGGGIGRLQRHFGLTIDNLRSVELVTADGRLVRASLDEEPELFWGIRGAGTNFGVVTRFEFGLHPFEGTLHRGVRIHPADQLHALWAMYRDWATGAPDTISASFAIGRAVPADSYPDAVAGGMIVVIAYNHSGNADDVERDVAPLLAGPAPARSTMTSMPYLVVQGANDDAFAWGIRAAILTANIADCPADLLDALFAHLESGPPELSISMSSMGGAISRVAEDATAYAGRATPFDLSVDAYWSDPAEDELYQASIRRTMEIAGPYLGHGRYVNAQSDDGPELMRAAYGDAKLARLRALKRAWDPANVFRSNPNIEPD
jgi:FAD/FMN-containing dehydrogenase